MNSLKDRISMILSSQLSTDEKISKLNNLHDEVKGDSEQNLDIKMAVIHIDNAIEEIFGSELRRLNAIRERNLETVNLDDIELLKDGFALLFKLIDNILSWNPEKQASLEGVINRASLRAMMIDPAVSVKTKQEIMDNWEEYM